MHKALARKYFTAKPNHYRFLHCLTDKTLKKNTSYNFQHGQMRIVRKEIEVDERIVSVA